MADLEQLIAKARDNELTSSEIVDCLRGIGKLNHPQGCAEVRISGRYPTQLFLTTHDRHPQYTGECVEAALVAAYDDLQRIMAEESAA